MPVYELFGGKCREAASLYAHASGGDAQELEDNVRKYMEQGYRYVRCQMAVPGYSTYGRPHPPKGPDRARGNALPPGAFRLPAAAQIERARAPLGADSLLSHGAPVFERLRGTFGDDVELLHDVHERIPIPSPPAGQGCRTLPPLLPRGYALAPEDVDYFRISMRQQTSTPVAMGELFVNVGGTSPWSAAGLIDFMRVHVSDIGGLSRPWLAPC